MQNLLAIYHDNEIVFILLLSIMWMILKINEIPLMKTDFDLLYKDKKDENYYLNNHRMWNRMMNYMTDCKRIYRFTDWKYCLCSCCF